MRIITYFYLSTVKRIDSHSVQNKAKNDSKHWEKTNNAYLKLAFKRLRRPEFFSTVFTKALAKAFNYEHSLYCCWPVSYCNVWVCLNDMRKSCSTRRTRTLKFSMNKNGQKMKRTRISMRQLNQIGCVKIGDDFANGPPIYRWQFLFVKQLKCWKTTHWIILFDQKPAFGQNPPIERWSVT